MGEGRFLDLVHRLTALGFSFLVISFALLVLVPRHRVLFPFFNSLRLVHKNYKKKKIDLCKV
jgi:hypothetical protein